MKFISDKRFLFLGFAVSGILLYPTCRMVLYPAYKLKYCPPSRTIVVTGSTGNLGRSLCARLATFNQRVIMAARDMDKCKAVRREIVYRYESHNIVCRKLDLSSVESINQFSDEIIKSEPRIDVLINCAAIKNPPAERVLTKEGIELTYAVNYLGPYLLTMRLLDKLVESSKVTEASRIINFTGKPKKDWKIDLDDLNFDKRPYTPDAAFKQSKLALAYFTQLIDELAKKKKLDLFTFAIDFGNNTLKDSSIKGFTPLEELKNIGQSYSRLNPDMVIGSAVMCSVDDDIARRHHSGLLYQKMHLGWKFKAPADNENLGKLLWNKTADHFLNLATSKEKN